MIHILKSKEFLYLLNWGLSQLAQTAIEYFRVNAMFVERSVNRTVWMLGHVLPVHARQVFKQYRLA